MLKKDKLFLWGALLFCTFIGLRLASPLLLPLLSAIGASALLSSTGEWLSKRTHIPYGLCAIILTIGFFLLLGVIFLWLIARLTEEGRELLLGLSENREQIFRRLANISAGLSRFFPSILYQLLPENILDRAFSELLSFIIGKLGALLTSALGKAPNFFMSLLCFILSCFYLTADSRRIWARVSSLLGNGDGGRQKMLRHIWGLLARYLKAYGILFLLTLAISFIGMSLLRVPYAALLSVALALLDALPLLGSGVVLLPLAAFYLFSGRVSLSLMLLVLYGILTLIRQITEPRLIGKQLGLHPLAAFLLILLGLRYLGFIGVFAPLIVIITREIAFFEGK